MIHHKTCERCGKRFDAVNSNARFCRATCRVAAHRKKERAELHALREALASA